MTTETYDARRDPDVILLSPHYSDEFLGSRAFAYIRMSDNLPTRVDFGSDGEGDPLCPVKLFGPISRIWLASYDPESGMAWGVGEMMTRDGPCREAGTFPMHEIITQRQAGFIWERDLYYRPRRMSDILERGED